MNNFRHWLASIVALFFGLTMHAQHNSHHHEAGQTCVLIRSTDKAERRASKLAARLTPSEHEAGIINEGYHYVFRLALCITPAAFSQQFGSSKEQVYQWWETTEKRLNSHYTPEVGVRFKVIRDDRLIIPEVRDGEVLATYQIPERGTKVIDRCIDNSEYDLGVMISPPKQHILGMAWLSAGRMNSTKGHAFSYSDFESLAHEMGHLLGAEHTHSIADGYITEPGKGQSLMSYGDPRDFFALVSIRSIRQLLNSLNVYLDDTRSEEHRTHKNTSYTNMPYVVPAGATAPVIDQSRLAREYVVTRGTYFQLHIPVQQHGPQLLYWAHPFDVVRNTRNVNTLQPAYKPTNSPTVHFQPRYIESVENNEKMVREVPFSGDYRVGTYKFMLGVSDQAQYDNYQTSVRIVEGEEFKITYHNLGLEAVAGNLLRINWQPCHELYRHRKVRILLSDDFGQTFPYVLADEVPNTGSWSGHLPFLNIGEVSHPSFRLAKLYGGLIKIEVIGEAAYSVTATQPYSFQSGSAIRHGFTLAPKRVIFEPATVDATLPEPFVKVATLSDIPAVQPLRAKHMTQAHQQVVQPKETREGNIVRRTWTATLNGLTRTYTQVFMLPHTPTEHELADQQARPDAFLAHELYRNEGHLGYPLPTETAYKAFKKAYEQVYTQKGEFLASATREQVAALRQSLERLDKIDDTQIVYPEAGRYYALSAYHHHFGTEEQQYLRQSTGAVQLTDNPTEATKWFCKRVGDTYSFVDEQSRSFYVYGFSDSKAIRLERGVHWGVYTLVNSDGTALQHERLNPDIGYNRSYSNNPKANRKNDSRSAITTDFKLYLDEKHSNEPTVIGQEPFRITSAGYATLVLDKPWRVPSGLSAAIITDVVPAVEGHRLGLDYRYVANQIVPADVPVLVQGKAGEYSIDVLSAHALPQPEVNLLRGDALQTTTTNDVAYRYYVFTDSPEEGMPAGFYYQVPDGASVTSAPKRAYLALPQLHPAAQARGFSLSGTVTAIATVATLSPTAVVYDLEGHRLPAVQMPGLYIIDGKLTRVVR